MEKCRSGEADAFGGRVSSETGGEVRAIVVGRYLYVGAILPEPTGRVTARLIGRNPNWEEEDRLVVLCGADIGYTDRILQINPLGAYSVEKALHVRSSVLDVFPYSLEKPASQVVCRNATKPSHDDVQFYVGWQISARNHGRIGDLMDEVSDLRGVYRSAWLTEYTEHRLQSVLGRWDAEYEYWRRLQGRLWDVTHTFKQGDTLPDLEELRPRM